MSNKLKKIDTAMLFAAGFGKRLMPITASIPKPMVRVANKPLVDYVIDELIKVGIKKIVVNCHYLAPILCDHLQKYNNKVELITIFEPEILDTLGGLINALPQLGNKDFMALNSDVIWNSEHFKVNPLLQIEQEWDPKKMDMLLALTRKENYKGYDREGDFNLTKNHQLRVEQDVSKLPYAFVGLQIFSYDFIKNVDFEKISRNILYKRAVTSDGSLNRTYGIVSDGTWWHIGSVSQINEIDKI